MSASRAFPRRFLSLWMPFLPTDRVRNRPDRPPLDADVPLVLVAKTEGTQRIMAADRLAVAHGLSPGMALAQARAMIPGLAALPYDQHADARLLETIADWADRYTPLVGRDPPHGLMLDITGAAHLKGGEAALAADLVGRLARQDVFATVAIAPTVGAAWALARHAGSDTAILAEDVTRATLDAVLARLPVGALRLAAGTTAALRRVGLKRIGDLIGRPRSALAARFGAPLILQLDRARGIDSEAISPRQPIPPAIVEQGFAEPILATAAVERTCRLLAERLAVLLDERGQGAVALELAVYRVDGLAKRIALRLAAPCRNAKIMADLMGLRLGHLDDPLDPGFGYDLVRLAATAVAPKGAEARPLAGLDDLAAPVSLAEACGPLIDRLSARFGADAVQAIALADTHTPEQPARLVAATAARPETTPQTRSHAQPSVPDSAPTSAAPVRPARADRRDGRGARWPAYPFRWRRRQVRIVAAHGPERIAPEWWLPQVLAGTFTAPSANDRACVSTRDYWRIEDVSGRRLWLYREGFYGAPSSAESAPASAEGARSPRWYVHGLFA